VVDDGSTDKTCEAVAPYVGCSVRYERIEHAGLPAPINRGLELARGEYVMLANDHDLYAFETLAALSEALEAHPSAALAVSDVVLGPCSRLQAWVFSSRSFHSITIHRCRRSAR
jgi:glycosyltransferase involved in cell wall biosynthesis